MNNLLAQKDSTFKKFTYARIGIDVSKIVSSALQKQYSAYELQVDINYTPSVFLVSEFGYGNSIVDNEYLKYSSKNTFLRLGLDKTFFGKEFPGDYDNAFVGLRYGLSSITRSDAAYFVSDPIWGNTNGTIPNANFFVHWIELTGGFRMELFKNVFVGWNLRGKTFINPKKFELLPPSYVAGYGRGDKNTAFGFNFYILYGIGKRN